METETSYKDFFEELTGNFNVSSSLDITELMFIFLHVIMILCSCRRTSFLEMHAEYWGDCYDGRNLPLNGSAQNKVCDKCHICVGRE